MREIVSPLSGFGSPFGGRKSFNPIRLFQAGEQGAWFEPSPTTCFTDTARTTPASVGQAVAGMTDLSGRGNHATQDITSARPTLARVPASGRRNLLTRTEEFDNAAWNKSSVGSLVVGELNPFGDATATTFTDSGAGGTGNATINQNVTLFAFTTYTYSVYAKKGTLNFISLSNLNFTTGNGTSWFNLDTGTVSINNANHTATISDEGNGWYRCSIVFATETDTTGNVWFTFNSSASFTTPLNGTSTLIFWGAQLETGSTATTYQRVGSTFDVTEAGQPDNFFLFNDLIDDAINWTAPAGDYTIAFIDTGATVTLLASQALSGATNLLNTARTGPYIAVDRALTTAEQGNVTAYLEGKGGGL